jgi:nitrogen fixation protein FixH
MRIRATVTLIAITAILLTLAACSRSGPSNNPSGNERIIKSERSGDITIALSSATGEVRSGENDLTLSFTDASGKPVDMPAASLKFHMPAMGSMAEMNDVATLTTTATRGKFHAQVNIEVAGSWEAMISFQGPRGTEQATMSVNAR